MDIVRQAYRLIRGCELEIKALMEAAIKDRHYDEIGRLAALAARLSALIGEEESDEGDNYVPPPLAPTTPALSQPRSAAHETLARAEPAVRAASIGRRRRDQYPRFERHADRLMKLGWSKKDRAEYEHRAPLETVRSVVSKLSSSVRKDGYLRMEDVLPIVSPDGTEIPSYQAYLVLAWLREMGVFQRQGNDGYKLVWKRLDENDLENVWKQTPARP